MSFENVRQGLINSPQRNHSNSSPGRQSEDKK
jgi:hypothetical protein